MDWANEDYVRIYTRDTADLMAIGPEGRAVWWEILRKADKSGVIDHGGDLDTLPELLRVPHEWFEKSIPKILRRGMAIDNGSALVVPNHEPAQTTPKSDKQRQKEARQKRRIASLEDVTKRDDVKSQNVTPESRPVTNRDGIVTDGHTASRDVTQRYATQPSDAENSEARTSSGAREVSLMEIASVYDMYPLKKGKKAGMAKAVKVILTREDFDKYRLCVAHMARSFAGDTTYCPHFSTFVSQRLWDDEEWPSPKKDPGPQNHRRGLSPADIAQMAKDAEDEENRSA